MSKTTRSFIRECAKKGWAFKVYYEGDCKHAYKGVDPDKAHEELYACCSGSIEIFGKDRNKITMIFMEWNDNTVGQDFYDYSMMRDKSKNHPEFDEFEKMIKRYYD